MEKSIFQNEILKNQADWQFEKKYTIKMMYLWLILVKDFIVVMKMKVYVSRILRLKFLVNSYSYLCHLLPTSIVLWA